MKTRDNLDIIRLMTLIVALKSKNGVVLAGDKRNFEPTTCSYNDNAVKVFGLNEKVAIAGAGDGYDAKAVIDELLKDPKIKDINIEEAKELLAEKAKTKQLEWVSKINNDKLIQLGIVRKPEFGFLLIGLTEDNVPKIYSLTATNLVPREIPDNHCQIGVVDIAKYIFLTEYNENMKLEELEKLAIKSIEGTGKVSAVVSNIFDLIKIEVK